MSGREQLRQWVPTGAAHRQQIEDFTGIALGGHYLASARGWRR